MPNICTARAGVVILHGLFSDEGIPAGERGPAAFVNPCRYHWADVLHLCDSAFLGISSPEDCKGRLTQHLVWGSWNGCRPIVVSADRPKMEHINHHWARFIGTVSPAPVWIQATRSNAMQKIREAARTADIVFIWQPSKLFVGGTAWDNAQLVLDAVHGGGALYGFDDDQVHITKPKLRTAYA